MWRLVSSNILIAVTSSGLGSCPILLRLPAFCWPSRCLISIFVSRSKMAKNVYQSINHFKLQHKRVFFYQLIDSVTLMQRIANIFLPSWHLLSASILEQLCWWWRYQWMKPYSLDPVSPRDCPHHYQATSCSAAGGGPLPYHDNFQKPGDLGPSNNDIVLYPTSYTPIPNHQYIVDCGHFKGDHCPAHQRWHYCWLLNIPWSYNTMNACCCL